MAGVVGSAYLCVSQHTHCFPSTGPQQARKTHTYPQPTRYSLPFLGPARGDWTQGGSPCQNNRRDKDRPCAVLRSRTGVLGPRVEEPRSQGCGASGYPSFLLLVPPPCHPQPSCGASQAALGASPSQPPHGSWPGPAGAAAPLLLTSGAGPAPSRRCSGGTRRRLQRPAAATVASVTTEVPAPLPSPSPHQKVKAQRGKLRRKEMTGSWGLQGARRRAWPFVYGSPFHPRQRLRSLLYRCATSSGLPGRAPDVRLKARSSPPAPALFLLGGGPILLGSSEEGGFKGPVSQGHVVKGFTKGGPS